MMKKNKSGKLKIIKTAKARLEEYFIEQMWGTGIEQLEEIVLWMPPAQRPPLYPPPALMGQLQLFRFLNNFNQYCDRGKKSQQIEKSFAIKFACKINSQVVIFYRCITRILRNNLRKLSR